VVFLHIEAISYVVDVTAARSSRRALLDYVLFVIYFPHLIAGPIMRAKDFLPQIVAPRTWNWTQFYEGCHLFFWGLFEKIFIADNLAKIVNPVFAGTGPVRWGGGADRALRVRVPDFSAILTVIPTWLEAWENAWVLRSRSISSCRISPKTRRSFGSAGISVCRLVSGLCVHSAGREPLRDGEDVRESVDDHAAVRGCGTALPGRLWPGACITRCF